MAAKSSPGGFVVTTVTNPGSFMATIINKSTRGADASVQQALALVKECMRRTACSKWVQLCQTAT